MNREFSATRSATKCARPLLLSFGLLAAAAVAQAQIEIRTAVGSAPNVFTGIPPQSGYDVWQKNAFEALATGVRAYGDPSLPTYFEARERFDATDLIATTFASWQGKYFDPSTTNPYGPAFASQNGNRLTYVSLIRDRSGAQVNVSSGVTASLKYPNGFATGNTASTGYADLGDQTFHSFTTNNAGRVTTVIGVRVLPGHTLGDGSDVFVTSGSDPVDAILVTSPGFAYSNDTSGDPAYGPPQSQIQLVAEYVRKFREVAFLGQVAFGGALGAATAVVNPNLPVDLNGNYISPTTLDVNVPGLASATTNPGGTGNFGKVIERSRNASPASHEGSLTPFSDEIKPPASLAVDLTNHSFSFNVDLGDYTKYTDNDVVNGEKFIVGTGPQAAGADGTPSVWVSFRRVSNVFVARLETTEGGSQDLYMPSDNHRFRVTVSFTGSQATATFARADGYTMGNQNDLTVTLPAGFPLTSAAFSAGFLSHAPATSPMATLTGFSTDALQDTMYTFADNAYVKPNDPILFNLGTVNKRTYEDQDPAGTVLGFDGYQAFLQPIGSGVETFGLGRLVGSPFSTFVLNGPYQGILTFAANVGFYNSNPSDYAQYPTGGNSILSKVYEVAGTATSGFNVVGLGIMAQTPGGSKTKFAINDGDALIPTLVGSNRVVIDNDAPVVASNGLYRGTQALTGIVTQGAVQLRFAAVDSVATYSGLAAVPTATITFSNGTQQTLNVYAGDSASSGFLADFAFDANTPNGAATILITATDRVGKFTTQTVPFNVNVAQVVLTVTVNGLNPNSGPGAGFDNVVTRGLQITVGGDIGATGGTAPLMINRDVDFAGSNTATIVLTAADGIQPNQAYTTASIKDRLHALRRTVSIGDGSNLAQFSGTLSLIQGDLNNDNMIDILDYASYAQRVNQDTSGAGSGVGQDTPLSYTGNRHPDFTGDGNVRVQDGTFIVNNFLLIGDDVPGTSGMRAMLAPGGGTTGRPGALGGATNMKKGPKSTATIEELVASGIDKRTAVSMDLDGNGIVTMAEIAQWSMGRH